MPEARVGQGLQHAHHRGGNAGTAHETHDPIAGAVLLAVEADDEAGHHTDAVAGDPVDRFLQRAACVLVLARHRETCLVGRFDAQEHRLEPRLGHHPHHLLIRGEIHGGLGGEAERIPPLDLPLLDGRQQQLGVALVADEVVVHQEDGATPAQVVERLQLSHQLLGCLGARLAPVQHDDVAELALERATTRELHAHRVVGVELKQIEAGHRRGGHVRLLAVGAEAAAALPPFDGFDKQGQGDLTLIEHLEIGQLDLGRIGRGAGEWSTHRHRQTPLFGTGDLLGHVGLLHDHPGDHHQLGPGPFGLAHLPHIAVHQLHLPVLGQQGGHGHQAERRQQHLAVHQLEDLLVAPEGLRELGIDEERAHAVAGPGAGWSLS